MDAGTFGSVVIGSGSALDTVIGTMNGARATGDGICIGADGSASGGTKSSIGAWQMHTAMRGAPGTPG